MKKEKKMPNVKVGEAEQKQAVVSLAFRVRADGDNLFSAEILLLHDDKVVEKRNGVSTTLGHAIGAADDLMDGWAFSEVEQTAEEYFRNVYL
jgi:hypothetical protein